MDAIKEYIESLFLGIPESHEKEQLKNDLLANMEDRYEELIQDGKEENEAIGITIKEFGSMDEIIEELDFPSYEKEEQVFEGKEILEEEAEDYFKVFRKSAMGIGTGVLLVLLSLASLVALTHLEGILIGIPAMLIFVAAAVGFFIFSGFSLTTANKKLDDRPISEKASKLAAKSKMEFRLSFIICIVSGVILCIASPALLLIVSRLSSLAAGILWMFLTVGFGVFFLIYGGMVQSSYTRLADGRIFIADEDNLGPRARSERNRELTPLQQLLDRYFWPLTIVIYLVWSFLFHSWSISWIIFPVFAFLHEAIEGK
jgi:hypothetical protein